MAEVLPFLPPEPSVIRKSAVPDLFIYVSKLNPDRSLVQVLHEQTDGSIQIEHITWSTVISQASIAATDLRSRWASKLPYAIQALLSKPRKAGTQPFIIAILASSGYEYFVNLLACSINRWSVFFISPRNSVAAITHLVYTSNAAALLFDRSTYPVARKVRDHLPHLVTLEFVSTRTKATLSSLSILEPLNAEEIEKEQDVPVFFLHTSDLTGYPKIIPWTHKFFLAGTYSHRTQDTIYAGLTYYTNLPLFHSMGLIFGPMFALGQGNIITFVSSSNPRPVSTSALLHYIPCLQKGVVVTPPSTLEELYHLGPEAVKTVAQGTSAVFCGGAPLNESTGNALVDLGLNVCTVYGSAEINIGTSLVKKDHKLWQYVHLRKGYKWHWLSIDGSSSLKEMVVGADDDTPAVINSEEPLGYATMDIWEPHPTIPDLWRYHSRKGDLTIWNNEEDTNNEQIESLLKQDEKILHVQVFGAGRSMNGVLVSPVDTIYPNDAAVFLTSIQHTLDAANNILPKHSRLVPQLIIVAKPEKPFVITDKGTVKAKETLDLYAKEIEEAYARLESGDSASRWEFNGNAANPENVNKFLNEVVKDLLAQDIGNSSDLFEFGLDSLSAVQLRAALLSATRNMQIQAQAIPRNIVYSYPTIDALVGYVCNLQPNLPIIQEQIKNMIAKYSKDFTKRQAGIQESRSAGMVIALTGSTGSLGSLLLDLILGRRDVAHVYLLNRKNSTPQQERQLAGLRDKGLNTAILSEKAHMITYLDVDLSKRDLGLSSGQYSDLRDNITHIIHVAWHLKFNLILESYERVHVAGTRHLIDLALASPREETPRLVFTSTAAASALYKGDKVPEVPIDDFSIVLNQGYAQSKYVSERILVNATEAGLRATVVRVGQLAGVSSNGAWSVNEHVPVLIRSSIVMGMIPDDLAPVRWIPLDLAASAILKQMCSSTEPLEYFSVENTVDTPWGLIARAVITASPRSLRLVPASTWLEVAGASDTNPEKVPAARLLDFFHRMANSQPFAVLSVERSILVAPELNYGLIPDELIKRYVAYQIRAAGLV